MQTNNQVNYVYEFETLLHPPASNVHNAWCWKRQLKGNFEELVLKLQNDESIRVVTDADLIGLELTLEGQLARNEVLGDMHRLRAIGADPVLNVIRSYERDVENPIFPTDVYSFHADQSPIATYTFLCTYFGATSEIAPNAYCIKKLDVPEYRQAILKHFTGPQEKLNDFLREQFFDLHYDIAIGAPILKMEVGDLWKLAVDHPASVVPPCIHRAPVEQPGESRLLLIC
jgi:hypothetical protein